MVDRNGEISNQLFDTLQDWNTVLQGISDDLEPLDENELSQVYKTR